jgi:hypothetical protein
MRHTQLCIIPVHRLYSAVHIKKLFEECRGGQGADHGRDPGRIRRTGRPPRAEGQGTTESKVERLRRRCGRKYRSRITG